jgi:hypothetical protein
MNKVLMVTLLLFLGSLKCFSQGEVLNNFSFIVVPERFDFQYEEDQYQLNSLLKFLFNKHGFHAYFDTELPDVRRCDGLRAVVSGKPGFVWTEVVIKIVDCDGFLLYQSAVGQSKLKDYAKAYTESLRKAFESIEILGVQQKEVRVLTEAQGQPAPVETSKPEVVVEEGKDPLKANPLLLPTTKYSNYTCNDKNYLLRRTSEGFRLFEESVDNGEDMTYVGKVFEVSGVLFFENVEETRFLAKFDSNGNLTVTKDSGEVVYVRSH